MKVGLDTSVVLRLLVGEPADQARQAVAFLDGLLGQGHEAVVSDVVVGETYFALQYHYQVPKAEALAALDGLFEAGEVKNLGVAAQVLKTPHLASANPGFLDRVIHRHYLKEADQMATFEKAAHKLDGVRLLR